MYSSLIDRKALQREKSNLCQDVLNDSCRILLFHERGFLIQPDSIYFSIETIEMFRSHLSEPIYLGEYENQSYFGFHSLDKHEHFDTLVKKDLREISITLDRFESALLFYCQSILTWHVRHPFCSRCGSHTKITQTGHARRCQNAECNTQHFPKIEPAVIFLVLNHQQPETRLLLARQESWEPHRFSLLAGFVETGESLEDAVKREAYEESGLRVENVNYIASQPWPFPSSLMLGFECVTSETEVNLIDQELSEAYWFTAKEIETKVKAESLKLPHKRSIAWSLINKWFTEEIGYSLDDIN